MNLKRARKKYLKQIEKQKLIEDNERWKRIINEVNDAYIHNRLFSYLDSEFPKPDLIAEQIKDYLKRQKINFTFSKHKYFGLGCFHYEFKFEEAENVEDKR